MHRHVPVSILAIVAIVGIAVLLYSVMLPPEVGPLAVQYIPAPHGPAAPGNTFIIPNLNTGDFLGKDYPVISGDIIPAIGPQTVTGKETRADVFQTVELRNTQPGGFNGGQIKFARTDLTNTVTDFIDFSDVVFAVVLDFSSGLQSKIEGGEAKDLEELDMNILGDRYSIATAEVSGNDVRLRLFGGYGSIDLEDNNVADDNFYQGAKVNQQSVDADVKIRASISGDNINIYSIAYRLNANAAQGGDLQVIPQHCTREYLQYPTGMLSPNFDICYAGLSGPAAGPPAGGISGNQVKLDPRGNDKYDLIFSNNRGQVYKTPLADTEGGLHYGRGTRNLVFKEAAAPGAPNIALSDYVVLMSRESVTGVTNVVQYKSIDTGTVYFIDLASGDQRTATFDPGTGQGQLLLGDGTYSFVVGAGNMLAMDQTNNGAIAGNEAKIILPGGTKIDLSPGFTESVVTPAQLFEEPMGDEVTTFKIIGGGDINVVVPSPQTTLPGNTFTMLGQGGGVSSGLTKYGILFTLATDHSGVLNLVVPGGYSRPVKGGAQGGVYVTFERPKLMKPTQAPPAVCGNKLKEAGEYCDPAGSLCIGQKAFERGVCSSDCKTCTIKPRTVCGNQVKEEGEECETNVDCQVGFACGGCKCLPLPTPVCGNHLLDYNEQCEADVDCAPGMMCSACNCIPAPVVEAPAPQPEKLNIFATFFRWLASLFGG